MKPIEFAEQNVVFAKHQPAYLPLPAHQFYGSDHGRIAFCWKLSLRDRLKLALTGKLWHQVLIFNKPLQPQLLTADKPEMNK